MTQGIEQLIKLHDAQALSIESMGAGRGRGILTKEQQIGAFATAQRKCQVGFDILMVKHRQDEQAEMRVRKAIITWCLTRPGQEFAINACHLSLSVIAGRVLPSQHAHIAALLRRHSRQAQNSRRLSDACNETIKGMIRRGGDPEYIEMQKERVREIKESLYAWSVKAAMATTVCARCAGTCVIKTKEPCPECSGTGRITSSIKDIELSLRECGLKITSQDWQERYLPVVTACMQWLYLKESEAADIIAKRIRQELQGVA